MPIRHVFQSPSYGYFVLILALTGCQPSTEEATETESTAQSTEIQGSEDTLSVINTVPTYPADIVQIALSHDGLPQTLASLNGDVFIGTDSGTLLGTPSSLQALNIYTNTTNYPSEAAVSAMTIWGDELLVAAEDGLFVANSGSLIESAASDELEGLDILDLSVLEVDGVDHLWIAAQSGLYRLTEDALERIELPHGPTLIRHLAHLDDLIFAAGDNVLVQVNASNLQVVQTPDLGTINGLYASSEQLFIASSAGACLRDSQGEYICYALGESATATWAVSANIAGEGIFATDTSLVSLTDDGLKGLSQFQSPLKPIALATDILDHIWLATADEITIHEVGEAIRFEDRVAPIFDANCASCHQDGASGPKHDFTNYDEVMALSDAILERVFTQQMPPSMPLSDGEYDTIAQWYETGQAP